MQDFELCQTSLMEVIKALVADELKGLRPEMAQEIFPEDWNKHTSVHPLPADTNQLSLQADSMEKLALATRVADFFQIRESGLEDYLLRFKTLGEWAELVAESRKRGSQGITFTTSGSTGEPKPCDQTWSSLINEAQFFVQVFQNTLTPAPQRVIALTPAQHIYGFLFSVLLPDLMNLPVIRGTQAFSSVQGRRLQAGDLIVGFPFAWKQISRSQRPFPPGVTGITSTGPCDPQVIHALHQQQLAQLFEIYGSSETGGIGWRHQTNQPFQLLPRWQQVKEESQLLFDTHHACQQPLNDHLQWQDHQHFYPQGRLDEAVQVGGINVFPTQLAQQLRQLPQVKDAAVRLMAPAEGDRLKAFIVPAATQLSEAELRESLHTWCQAHLSTVQRPQALTFGPQLPTNAMGKACDWPINASNQTTTE